MPGMALLFPSIMMNYYNILEMLINKQKYIQKLINLLTKYDTGAYTSIC